MEWNVCWWTSVICCSQAWVLWLDDVMRKMRMNEWWTTGWLLQLSSTASLSSSSLSSSSLELSPWLLWPLLPDIGILIILSSRYHATQIQKCKQRKWVKCVIVCRKRAAFNYRQNSAYRPNIFELRYWRDAQLELFTLCCYETSIIVRPALVNVWLRYAIFVF